MHPFTNIAIQSVREASKLLGRLRHQVPSAKKTFPDLLKFLEAARERLFEVCSECILNFHPEHIVCRELSEADPLGDQPVWLVEPLDGGLNYLRGIENYASAIAVVLGARPIHGVVIDHCRNEVYQVSKDEASLRDGRRIRCAPLRPLAGSVIGYECMDRELLDPPESETQAQPRETLFALSRTLRQSGSASLCLSHVATGQLDGCVLDGVQTRHLYAPIMLVRAAGGFVGDRFGGEVTTATDQLVAGSASVFRAIVSENRKRSGFGLSPIAKPV